MVELMGIVSLRLITRRVTPKFSVELARIALASKFVHSKHSTSVVSFKALRASIEKWKADKTFSIYF